MTESPDKPWHTEPRAVDFMHAGLRCAMRRWDLGSWCGYVGVPDTHPLWGANYDTRVDFHDPGRLPVELDNVGIINVFIEVMSGIDIAEDNSIPVSFLLPVHGGLTWANHYEMLPKREKKLWWFGFDCMHSGDFVPGLHDEQMSPYSFPTRYTKQLVYRDQDYVTNQVKQLAEKLRLLASLPELNDHKQTESRDSVSQAPPDGHQ